MATTFYKLKEGDKFYRLDLEYDENNNLIDYIRHDYVMKRDASIENYNVRFMCYDSVKQGNTMFMVDLNMQDNQKRIYDDETNVYKRYLTVSKKKCDAECARLDEIIGRNVNTEDSSDGEEG